LFSARLVAPLLIDGDRLAAEAAPAGHVENLPGDAEETSPIGAQLTDVGAETATIAAWSVTVFQPSTWARVIPPQPIKPILSVMTFPLL